MKRTLALFMCLSSFLLSACAKSYHCDCCGEAVDVNEAQLISYCADETKSGTITMSECYLCKPCYEEAIALLIETLDGSLLEEYLFEYLAYEFQGSNFEEFLEDQGYEITYIG